MGIHIIIGKPALKKSWKIDMNKKKADRNDQHPNIESN